MKGLLKCEQLLSAQVEFNPFEPVLSDCFCAVWHLVPHQKLYVYFSSDSCPQLKIDYVRIDRFCGESYDLRVTARYVHVRDWFGRLEEDLGLEGLTHHQRFAHVATWEREAGIELA